MERGDSSIHGDEMVGMFFMPWCRLGVGQRVAEVRMGWEVGVCGVVGYDAKTECLVQG